MDLSYFYIRSGMGTIQHGMAQCVAAVTRDAVQYGALRRRFSCENGEVYMAPCRAVPCRAGSGVKEPYSNGVVAAT